MPSTEPEEGAPRTDMEAVQEATLALIQVISAAQTRWAISRNVTTGLTERLAIYCAFKACLNAFPLEPILDTEALALVQAFAESIQITTASKAPETVKVYA